MSKTTREINKITTTVISISVKLILYALIILLLYEAVTQGFAFGHEIFYAEAAEEEPGRDVTVNISQEDSLKDTASILAEYGLITNEFAFVFQGLFYDYGDIYPGTYTLNTSMTSKEILQVLNEAPVEETAEAALQKSRAASAQETAAQEAASAQETASTQETGAAAVQEAAAPLSAAPESEASYGEDDAAYAGDGAAYAGDEAAYAGDEAEEEGGWIEDVAGEEVS